MGVSLEKLEAACRRLGNTIGEVVGPGTAFMVVLSDFGDAGNMTYLSNVDRLDMVKMLRELADKLEADPTGRGILTRQPRRR
jgi:hypothetical protein